MKYKVRFIGRLNGALGIRYGHQLTIEAPENASKEELQLIAYKTHESISGFRIVEIDGKPTTTK